MSRISRHHKLLRDDLAGPMDILRGGSGKENEGPVPEQGGTALRRTTAHVGHVVEGVTHRIVVGQLLYCLGGDRQLSQWEHNRVLFDVC